jgi:hypothetical protein
VGFAAASVGRRGLSGNPKLIEKDIEIKSLGKA